MINSSDKALEMKTSTVFNLVFASNTILSCFFLFFLIIDLYFLIPGVIFKVIPAHIFNPTAELVIFTGILAHEANAGIETQPLTAKAKTRKCSK